MDALELLEKDHRKVEALFLKIGETTTEGKKHRLFDELYTELELHSSAEEEALYPVAEKFEKTKDEAERSYKEHDKVRSLLKKIARNKTGSTEWKALVEELQSDVEHHVKEEEGKLFPNLRRILSVEELKSIKNGLEKSKSVHRKAG